LEQVLLEPAVETTSAFLAKPEAVAMIAQVPLTDLTLELVPIGLLSSFQSLLFSPTFPPVTI